MSSLTLWNTCNREPGESGGESGSKSRKRGEPGFSRVGGGESGKKSPKKGAPRFFVLCGGESGSMSTLNGDSGAPDRSFIGTSSGIGSGKISSKGLGDMSGIMSSSENGDVQAEPKRKE